MRAAATQCPTCGSRVSDDTADSKLFGAFASVMLQDLSPSPIPTMKTHTLRRTRFLAPIRLPLIAAGLALAACASSDSPAPDNAPDDAAVLGLGIRNAVVVEQHVISSGQPTPEQFSALASHGYSTVIGLRVASENGTGWEEDAAEAAGLSYVRIPIAGGGALELTTGAVLDGALASAESGGVLVACGSGNRVGAAFALRAATVRNVAPEAALELGRAAGMTGTEPRVRELLGLPPAD